MSEWWFSVVVLFLIEVKEFPLVLSYVLPGSTIELGSTWHPSSLINWCLTAMKSSIMRRADLLATKVGGNWVNPSFIHVVLIDLDRIPIVKVVFWCATSNVLYFVSVRLVIEEAYFSGVMLQLRCLRLGISGLFFSMDRGRSSDSSLESCRL